MVNVQALDVNVQFQYELYSICNYNIVVTIVAHTCDYVCSVQVAI